MSTKLINCSCKHDFQDQEYNGKRLANKTNSNWRCTVCDKESVVEVKSKAKK